MIILISGEHKTTTTNVHNCFLFQNKESYKKLVVSSRPIPDIEQLLQEEYDDEDVNVKIVELSTDTLQKRDLVIGENKPRVQKPKLEAKKKESSNVNGIKGMETDAESEEEESKTENEESNVKSKKELKRMLKKQATKKIQKSKVFQMKSKLDRVKNKKKAQQKKGRMKAKCDPRTDKSKKKVGRRKN